MYLSLYFPVTSQGIKESLSLASTKTQGITSRRL